MGHHRPFTGYIKSSIDEGSGYSAHSQRYLANINFSHEDLVPIEPTALYRVVVLNPRNDFIPPNLQHLYRRNG